MLFAKHGREMKGERVMEHDTRMELQSDIERAASDALDIPEAELLSLIGRQVDDTSFFTFPGDEHYAQAARRFLTTTAVLRKTACTAANHRVIDDTLSKTNVTALATAVLPVFFAAAPLPAEAAPFVASVAVAILRIGLNQYCSGMVDD